MSEPWFDVVSTDAGARFRMSDDGRASLTSHLDRVLRLLENGVMPPGRAEPNADELLRRMFAVSEEFWTRSAATTSAALQFSGVADRLVVALRPGSATGWPD